MHVQHIAIFLPKKRNRKKLNFTKIKKFLFARVQYVRPSSASKDFSYASQLTHVIGIFTWRTVILGWQQIPHRFTHTKIGNIHMPFCFVIWPENWGGLRKGAKAISFSVGRNSNSMPCSPQRAFYLQIVQDAPRTLNVLPLRVDSFLSTLIWWLSFYHPQLWRETQVDKPVYLRLRLC